MIVKKCMIGYNKGHILVEVSRAHKSLEGGGVKVYNRVKNVCFILCYWCANPGLAEKLLNQFSRCKRNHFNIFPTLTRFAQKSKFVFQKL